MDILALVNFLSLSFVSENVNNFFMFFSLFLFSLDLFLPTLLQQLQRVFWLQPVKVRAEMLPSGCVWIDNRYLGTGYRAYLQQQARTESDMQKSKMDWLE